MWKFEFGGAHTSRPGLQMNTSKTTRTTHAFRLHPLNVMLAALALLLLALAAPVEAGPGHDKRAPDLGECQNLQVPAGNKLAFHVFGVGVQIYTWTGTSWSFVSPEAVLFAVPGDHVVVGFHYAGPTWESLSGSNVVGTVIQSSTPNPDAIPWLLLGAASNEGHGIFQRVTFIQRLYTVGGNAPTVPGDTAGQVARVPYTARYFFYRADH
jgi:hypothetical protein